MSDTITIDGVTLTTEEAREVLAWVDEPLGEAPKRLYLSAARITCLRLHPHEAIAINEPDREGVELTPDIIEQLRDHCFPWREVRRDEVEPGEVFRMPMSGEALTALTGPHPTYGGLASVDSCHRLRHGDGRSTVLVRRPREVGTRLRDVDPGTLVERVDDGEQGRRLGWDYVHGGGGVILEGNWRLADWPGDTLVRIVEGEL